MQPEANRTNRRNTTMTMLPLSATTGVLGLLTWIDTFHVFTAVFALGGFISLLLYFRKYGE